MNSYCNVVFYWNLESYERVLSMPNMHGYVSDMSCEFGLESMQHSMTYQLITQCSLVVKISEKINHDVS